MKQKVCLNCLTEQEKGYLVGLFMGDGYSHYSTKDRHYRVEFHLNSERDGDILNYLKNIITKLEIKSFIQPDKRNNSNKLFVNSKEFMHFIYNQIEELYPLSNNTHYRIGLVSGFIDAEGWVRKGDIVLTQKNKKVLLLFQEILSTLGVSYKMWFSKGYKGNEEGVWRLRISTTFKYASHNSLKLRRVYGKSALHSELYP